MSFVRICCYISVALKIGGYWMIKNIGYIYIKLCSFFLVAVIIHDILYAVYLNAVFFVGLNLYA